MAFLVFPLGAMAAENREENVVAVFEDGSYIMETISFARTRASGTVTGTKTRTYYANDGGASWVAVLTGTFQYNGSSATCTSSSMDVTINHYAWSLESKSASKSGNTATGNASLVERAVGIVVRRESVNMTLTCDANGNLS